MGITAPFGRLLRTLRQSRRLTIEELAEASGISGRAIGGMERGRSRRPHRSTVTALAQGLGLDEAAHAGLAAARAARPGARTAESVRASAHTLPRGVRDFVGRQAELTELRALVREAAEGRGVAPPVAVVSGPPGSGKTSLAVRLAEEPSTPCPDGAFLVDMRGLDERPPSAEQAVTGLLGTWGVGDAELARLTAQERLARYHQVAAGLRAVLVLDNAGSEAQVRPLLPRAGRLLVVVTSRRTLAGLEGVRRVALGALNPRESAPPCCVPWWVPGAWTPNRGPRTSWPGCAGICRWRCGWPRTGPPPAPTGAWSGWPAASRTRTGGSTRSARAT